MEILLINNFWANWPTQTVQAPILNKLWEREGGWYKSWHDLGMLAILNYCSMWKEKELQ